MRPDQFNQLSVNGAVACDSRSPPVEHNHYRVWGIGSASKVVDSAWPLQVFIPLALCGLARGTEVNSCIGGRVPRVAGKR